MILVAIGSNLPGVHGEAPVENCRAAVRELDALPGLRLGRLSRWWRTAPIPASSQPDYINGVALLDGHMDPAELLARLHEIEAKAGRHRTVANAARPLDLDLIAIDDLVREDAAPVLPHPRAHERAFVLRPLADVAPNWVHPKCKAPLSALLQNVADQAAEPL